MSRPRPKLEEGGAVLPALAWYALASAALVVALWRALATWDDAPTLAKYERVFGGHASQVLVLGNSLTLHGVQPEAFGDGAYNHALSSATPAFYLDWYRAWREHHPPPKNILLGLDPLFVQRFTWTRTWAQDSGYWPWAFAFGELWRSQEPQVLLSNLCPLLRHRGRLQDALVAGVGEAPRATATGFVPLPASAGAMAGWPGWRPVEPPQAQEQAHNPTILPGDGLLALRSLLGRFRAEGVAVVAFQAPYPRPLTPEEARINVALEAMVGADRFLNFNGRWHSNLNAQSGAFADSLHRNEAGAKVFSAQLALALQQPR